MKSKLIVLATAALLAVTAHAKVLTSGTFPANFTFTSTTSKTPLPLNTGATSLVFRAAKAGTFVLTFSAECAADNGTSSTSGWVDVDVEVNGVVVSPTVGSSDAFCSPNGTVGHDGWVRASISVPVNLVAGSNTVRVLGGLNGLTSGWIGDTAIVVHD